MESRKNCKEKKRKERKETMELIAFLKISQPRSV